MKTRTRTESQRKSLYGISEKAFNAQLAHQKNRCPICQRVFKSKGRNGPHVDHDHDVGRLRGLLCFGCNVLLGHAQDDPELLKRAAKYLERFYLEYLQSVPHDEHQKHMELLFKVKKAGHWGDKVQAKAELARLILGLAKQEPHQGESAGDEEGAAQRRLR